MESQILYGKLLAKQKRPDQFSDILFTYINKINWNSLNGRKNKNKMKMVKRARDGWGLKGNVRHKTEAKWVKTGKSAK